MANKKDAWHHLVRTDIYTKRITIEIFPPHQATTEWASNEDHVSDQFESLLANSEQQCVEEKVLRDQVLAVHNEINSVNNQIDATMNNLIGLKDDMIDGRTEIATILRELIYSSS